MNEVLNKILNVTNEELNSLDMRFVTQYNFHHDANYFLLEAGKEHYRLLMFISTLYNKELFFDIGTNRCMSAAALSFSMKNRIKTYDIKTYLPANPILPRVQYCIGDATKDEELIKSSFIFFDAEHDGIFENIFMNYLREIKWKGLIIFDDIYANPTMTEFWNKIPEEKYDITKIGHWSGSGICLFE
jgi:predicted O-methyltransferase YrrM